MKRSSFNDAVYAELGRIPLITKRFCSISKFWKDVLCSNNCIVLKCYEKMYINCELHGHKNWASDVKKILNEIGFNEVWNKQTIDSLTLKVINQRIVDLAKQDIFGKIENSQKCHFYKYLVDGFYLQYYLRKSIPVKFQQCISKLRLSSHRLAIETGRYNNTQRAQRNCFSCKNYVEDEFHFILVCPVYIEYRQKYIKKYFYEKPSMFKLLQLFNNENFKDMCNLGKYIYYSMKLRNDICN